ncbi:BPSS1780 family membrane protein [Xenorhabdus bharatensis]|uniref:BPSS1780 family membrane protein n=1 Tax=Xenorhabdus bharatensis TaxID=3136256 RepID=UPI0030F3F55F
MDNQNINLNSGEQNVSLIKEKEIFIREGQSVGAGAATEWIGDAWKMFKANPSQWILFTFIYMLILGGLSVIPLLNYILTLFSPVFVAGIIAAAEKQRTTGNFKIDLLFYGFKEKLGSLVAVGALYLGICALGAVAAVLIAGIGMIDLILAAQDINAELDPEQLIAVIPSIMWACLVFWIFITIALAFIWFAPALIIINDLKFGEAVSMSLSAVKKNLFGGFLFFLLMGILFIVSLLPLFLGLIIMLPMNLIVYYTTYRSIFYKQEEKQIQSDFVI